MEETPLQIIEGFDVLHSSGEDFNQPRIGREGAMMAHMAIDDRLVALCPRGVGILTNLNREIPKGQNDRQSADDLSNRSYCFPVYVHLS